MKLYLESRYRTSGSNEDFVYQLPRGVDIPDSLAYIDCVCVPNTIYSVRQGANDKLYLREAKIASSGGAEVVTFRVVTIQPGQYNGITLAGAVQTALNIGTPMPSYTVTFELETAKLKIATSAAHGSNFIIYGDAHGLPGHWNANAPTNLHIGGQHHSANKVCGFLSVQELTGNTTTPLLGSDVVDIQRHHVMYIHSDLGSPDSSFGPQGESGIVRKVIVDAPQNGLAIDRHYTMYDSVEVAAQPLRSMRFSLRGSDGSLVDLHGHSWSFSVVFHDKL